MGQSRGNVAIGRALGGTGTSARAWSPSMQPLAPEVSLRSPVLFRPPRASITSSSTMGYNISD